MNVPSSRKPACVLSFDRPAALCSNPVKHLNGGIPELTPPRGGTIRYTMDLTDAGEWHEIGERSSDGTKWEKFFEMTLRKK